MKIAKNSEVIRVAIYARVSTDRQREKHTIDSQLRLLPEHAKREGWTVTEIYKDDGKSGETVEGRPDFTRLMDDAADKLFDIVLCIDLDRITRSKKSAEGAVIFDQLREYGIKLATPTQGIIDLDDEDQDLLVQIKREVAKWEKRKIVRRMTRGKREAAKKGKRFSCLDPFGLRWAVDENSPIGGRYEIVPAEALIVRRMFHLATVEGLGTNLVVWRLNQEGHRTRDIKRGSRPKGGQGEWAVSTVRKMLRSPTYRGEFLVFKSSDKTVIKVPAIIDAETWDRAQSALTDRKPEAKWKHDRQYLLSGLVRCAVCDAAMWAVNARQDRGNPQAYYRCSSTNSWRKMKMDGPCGNKHHKTDVVDAAVWAKLSEVLSQPALLADACALGVQPKGVDWTAQAAGARRTLGKLEKLEGETLRRHRRGLLSSSACDRELGEIAKERQLSERNLRLAEDQLGSAASRNRRIDDIGEQAAKLAKGIAKANFEARRDLIKLLVPVDLGCSVRIGVDGGINVQGILSTSTAPVEMTLKVAGHR